VKEQKVDPFSSHAGLGKGASTTIRAREQSTGGATCQFQHTMPARSDSDNAVSSEVNVLLLNTCIFCHSSMLSVVVISDNTQVYVVENGR
jgi:hypothetical protein